MQWAVRLHIDIFSEIYLSCISLSVRYSEVFMMSRNDCVQLKTVFPYIVLFNSFLCAMSPVSLINFRTHNKNFSGCFPIQNDIRIYYCTINVHLLTAVRKMSIDKSAYVWYRNAWKSLKIFFAHFLPNTNWIL